MSQKVKVIFRILEEEVIALFPEIPGDENPNTCLSYMHLGQHGSATLDLTYECRLAKPEEYAPLKEELESLEYDLDIRKRITRAMDESRLKELRSVLS